MMMRPVLVVLAAILLEVSASLVIAQAPPADFSVPAPGVLVLRNGQVLEGQVCQRGDLWVVLLAGGEIRLRASEVECCCTSLAEAYTRMRAGITAGCIYDHLRLAQWCVKQNLRAEAASELQQASALEPKHPMIAILQRRLEVAAAPPAAAAATATPNTDVSVEDLDRLVRGLPPQAIETFAQRVQPLLVNNCTTSGCHGIHASYNPRFLRTSPDRPPTARVTQRNLHAALQYIDRDKPANSKLLTVPTHPHGTAKVAIFADSDLAAYQRLLEWIELVADVPPSRRTQLAQPSVPVQQVFGAEQPSAPAARPRAVQAARRPASRPAHPPSLARSPASGAVVPAAATEEQRPGVDGPSKIHRGAAIPTAVPRDPFDPETFNRRFASPQQP